MTGSTETSSRKPRISVLITAAFFAVVLLLALQLSAFIAFDLDMPPVLALSCVAGLVWIAYTVLVLCFNIKIFRIAKTNNRMTAFRIAVNTIAASAGVFAVGFLFFYPILEYVIEKPTGHFAPYVIIIPLLAALVIIPFTLLPTALSYIIFIRR